MRVDGDRRVGTSMVCSIHFQKGRIMIERVDHVNLVVRDLDVMIAFYTEVLTLQVTKRVAIHGDWVDRVVGLQGVDAEVVYLESDGDTWIELIHYRAPAGKTADGVEWPNTYGIRHLAFRVADMDTTVAALRQAGVTLLGHVETVPTAQVTYTEDVRKRLVYFRDPEGNLLELCSYQKTGRGEGNGK